MNMNELLESLYQHDSAGSSIEKTAEQKLLNTLQDSGQAVENPFMEMDLDTLMKLASEEVLEESETTSVEEAGTAELEETAMDMLGGQIMAHACVHEFGLMKEAMMNGLCRVCKTNAMDIDGSSICSHCLSEG